MVESSVSRSFHYPKTSFRDEGRMCSAGQRRAVAEGWNLLNPGGEIGKEQTLKRALRAERSLARGASVNKHELISDVVLGLFLEGQLEEYVDSDGNYVLETATGEQQPGIFS